MCLRHVTLSFAFALEFTSPTSKSAFSDFERSLRVKKMRQVRARKVSATSFFALLLMWVLFQVSFVFLPTSTSTFALFYSADAQDDIVILQQCRPFSGRSRFGERGTTFCRPPSSKCCSGSSAMKTMSTPTATAVRESSSCRRTRGRHGSLDASNAKGRRLW